MIHPAEQYVDDVMNERVLTNTWVRLAVERHVKDLESGADRGLKFDRFKAEHACKFFDYLKHSKGEWAGRQFILSPWQAFIIWALFGWVHTDTNLRRFREGYNEVSRKNGKSTLAAGVGLKLFIADGEPGAEVYAAATKKDQSKIVFNEARNMVKKSPTLRKRIGIFRNNLNHPDSLSKFEPLGKDTDGMDGLNVHGGILDELHAHKDRLIYDLITTGVGARRQAMIFDITTAGVSRNSVCFDLHRYSKQVLEGVIEDDVLFAFIAAIDEDDSWEDESVWIKGNPNLGISAKLDDLRAKCKRAIGSPANQNSFRRLRLNEWTEQANRFIDLKRWDLCDEVVDEKALKGLPCVGGLDLSTTTDIAALVLAFLTDNQEIPLWCRFWIPEETAVERNRVDRVPYNLWIEQGHIKPTPGDVVDYDFVRTDINEIMDRFDIREIAADPWNATQMITNLNEDGIQTFKHRQGYASMSSPTKQMLAMILQERIKHGGNPVLRWMCANLSVDEDPAGNFKPSKSTSTEKIDGMVAAIMAVGRLLCGEGISPYESRGIRTL